jgi:predicted DsbA family dithiol-disulfide isomerase
MKIEIWSDFTCPWCYIAKLNLEEALRNKNIQVEYIYHSYQTVPKGYYPMGESFSIYEIARRSGMSNKQAVKKAKLIEDIGKKSGVSLNMNDVKMTDTSNVHRLLQLAHEYDCQDAFMMESYRVVFVEGQNIGDKNVLKELAAGVGIPEHAVDLLLESDNYLEEVQQDLDDAHTQNISGVPYYLFNDSESLYGAQAIDAFRKIINRVDNKTVPNGTYQL